MFSSKIIRFLFQLFFIIIWQYSISTSLFTLYINTIFGMLRNWKDEIERQLGIFQFTTSFLNPNFSPTKFIYTLQLFEVMEVLTFLIPIWCILQTIFCLLPECDKNFCFTDFKVHVLHFSCLRNFLRGDKYFF